MTIHVDPPILPIKDEPMALIPLGLLERAVERLREDAEEALLDGRPNTAKARECLADELATFLPEE